MVDSLQTLYSAFFSFDDCEHQSPRFISSVNDALYLWQNNILRIQNRLHERYQSYEIHPPFLPTGMSVSSDEFYVLLHSNYEIYIACPSQAEFPKSYKSPKPIKKLLWHPLAITYKCIVILHTDDTIRVVELNEPATLEGKIYNDKTRSFGLSERVHMIKDIQFDPTGLGLYILTAQNFVDIHIIYPLLPPRANLGHTRSPQPSTPDMKQVSAGNLTDYMLGKSLASAKLLKMKYLEERNIFLKERDTDKEKGNNFGSRYLLLRRDILKQIQFFKEVKEQLPTSVLVDNAFLDSVTQGPFRLRGLPSDLEMIDALALNILPLTQTIAILCVTFKDGNNLLLFPSSEPVMGWSKRDNNELNVLDTISTFKETGYPKLAYDNRLVFTSETSCNIVKMPWLKNLADCIRLNSLSKLQDLKFSNEVVRIEGRYEGVVAHVGSLILFDKDSIKIYKDKNSDENISPIEDAEEINYKYTTLLRTSVREIDILTQRMANLSTKYVSSVPISIASTPLGPESTVEQLEAVSSAYKEIMEKVQLGQTLNLRLMNKVSEQRDELYRQLKKFSDISAKKAQVEEQMQQLENRLIKYESKASLLEPRLHKLKDIVNKIENSEGIKNSNISDTEKSWFKNLREQVIKFNSFVKEELSLREELRFLRQQVAAMDLEQTNSQVLELETLQNMLRHDREIILSCANKISSATHEMKE